MENKKLALLSIALLAGCADPPPPQSTPSTLAENLVSSISFPGEQGGIIVQNGRCEAHLNNKQYKSRECSNEEAQLISLSFKQEKVEPPQTAIECKNEFLRVKVSSGFIVYGDKGCYSINNISYQGDTQQTEQVKHLAKLTKKIVENSDAFPR